MREVQDPVREEVWSRYFPDGCGHGPDRGECPFQGVCARQLGVRHVRVGLQCRRRSGAGGGHLHSSRLHICWQGCHTQGRLHAGQPVFSLPQEHQHCCGEAVWGGRCAIAGARGAESAWRVWGAAPRVVAAQVHNRSGGGRRKGEAQGEERAL